MPPGKKMLLRAVLDTRAIGSQPCGVRMWLSWASVQVFQGVCKLDADHDRVLPFV